MAKLNFLDRLVLFRHAIEKTVFVSKTLKVFHADSKDVPVILKFSYAGNVQYHKLTEQEVRKLISELRNATNLSQNSGET
ncbi:MAG: hypothetical protein WBC93_01715 [Sulfitobacter sp.]